MRLGIACVAALFVVAPGAYAQTIQTFEYDALGRLTKVTPSSGNPVIYTYDLADNRTNVTATPPSFSTTITITGTGPVDLRALANAAGYTGSTNATITYVLNSGTTITGAAGAPTGGYGIDTGTWPTSSYTINLSLSISGTVYGGGGRGGGGAASFGAGGAGGAAGDAIYCRVPMTITVNSGGAVKGGGGGGGGGGARRLVISGEPTFYGGGGGGGGFPNGPGGAVWSNPPYTATVGSAGTTGGGGAGGAGGGGAPGGGAGGGAATIGTNGGSSFSAGGGGGAAGYAVRKNGNTVTVTNSGTVTGTVG